MPTKSSSISDRLSKLEERVDTMCHEQEKFCDRVELLERGLLEQVRQSTAIKESVGKIENMVSTAMEISKENKDSIKNLSQTVSTMAESVTLMADTIMGNEKLGRTGMYVDFQTIKDDVRSLKASRAIVAGIGTALFGIAAFFHEYLSGIFSK